MRGRVKILLVTNNYPPEVGSAAHLFFDLANGLASRGCEVRVVTAFPRDYNTEQGYSLLRNTHGYVSRDSENLVTVLRIRTPRVPKDDVLLRGIAMFIDPIFLGLAIAEETLAWKPDVAIVYCPPLPLAALTSIIGRIQSLPIITNVQDLYPQTVIDVGLLNNRALIRIFRWLEVYVYRSSSIITVHSEGNAEYVAKVAPSPEKVRVVYNTSGPKARTTKQVQWVDLIGEDLRGKFVVTYAGVMAFHQGLDVVLETAARLRDVNDVVFLMVGDGLEKERLLAKAKDMNLQNVIFRNFQSRDKYAELVTLSDAALVTLRRDANPQVVPGKIQSIMQLGRPIVASVPPEGDAARLVKSSNSGICTTPGDSMMLSEAILRLRGDVKLRNDLGKSGLAYAERNFSVTVFVDSYVSLLSELRDRSQLERRSADVG